MSLHMISDVPEIERGLSIVARVSALKEVMVPNHIHIFEAMGFLFAVPDGSWQRILLPDSILVNWA